MNLSKSIAASLQTAPEQGLRAEASMPLAQAARRASRARCRWTYLRVLPLRSK